MRARGQPAQATLQSRTSTRDSCLRGALAKLTCDWQTAAAAHPSDYLNGHARRQGHAAREADGATARSRHDDHSARTHLEVSVSLYISVRRFGCLERRAKLGKRQVWIPKGLTHDYGAETCTFLTTMDACWS